MDQASNSQITVVKDVCARLDAAGVKFMVTGSFALCYFAEPRFTRDIDIVVDLEPGEAPAFVRLFEPDYYISEDAVRSAIARRGMFNILHLREAFKIDFILRKKTLFSHSEFARRTRVDFNGFPAWLVSKEDLIIAKLSWAKDSQSAFQLRDIKRLLEMGCDLDYVDKWVKTLSLETIFEKARTYG